MLVQSSIFSTYCGKNFGKKSSELIAEKILALFQFQSFLSSAGQLYLGLRKNGSCLKDNVKAESLFLRGTERGHYLVSAYKK
jgi:hypothetical protein